MKFTVVTFVILAFFVAIGNSAANPNYPRSRVQNSLWPFRKEFCDYPGCTCYYYKDPCPEGYYDCSSTRYCTLRTNHPCCY